MKTTTPRAETMIALLGCGGAHGAVAVTRDEMAAVRKLYGFTIEKPNAKPAPPKSPVRADYPNDAAFENAKRQHPAALKAHESWSDPVDFMQAGADRNAFRHAEADGLRMLAWLSRFVPAGTDPVKTLIQMAADAGFDVDHEDAGWAEDEDR